MGSAAKEIFKTTIFLEPTSSQCSFYSLLKNCQFNNLEEQIDVVIIF